MADPETKRAIAELNDRVATLTERVNFIESQRRPPVITKPPAPPSWATPQGDFGINATPANPADLAPARITTNPRADWRDPNTGLVRNSAGEIVPATPVVVRGPDRTFEHDQAVKLLDELIARSS